MTDADKKEYVREAAKRVFAAEFRETKISQKFDKEDDKAPVFVITQTGECANRLFIVGVLVSKEKKGDTNIFYRGAVEDMTGTFFVTANNFNPEAMSQMSRIDVKSSPKIVAIVGKPNIFETQEGTKFANLRVEEIREVDMQTRDLWILDTAKTTLSRIEQMERGVDAQLNEIRDTYKTNLPAYRAIVKKALEAIDLGKY